MPRRPRPSTRRGAGLIAAAVALATLLAAGAVAPGSAQPLDEVAPTPPALEVDVDWAWHHLEALQAIADAHGGHRSAGTGGYDASVAYVVDKLEEAGFAVELDDLEVQVPVPTADPTSTVDAPTPQVLTPGVDFAIASPPVAASLEGAPVRAVGTAGETDGLGPASGCAWTDFDGFPEGWVALVGLGGCEAWEKALNALDAGAAGVLFAGDTPVAERVELGGDPVLPVWSVSAPVAADLLGAAEAGTLVVSLDTGHTLEPRTTTNVVAERAGTDPSSGTLLLGSHLDSMITGPGINDPGSGVAVLLELAFALGEVRTERTVRLGFWAAEELGVLGSTHYVQGLAPPERADIVGYVNLDMVASPNWATFVYDPAVATDPATVSPGSEALTEVFRRWFAERGLPALSVWSDGRSDDAAFAAAGIPVGGLFSGAEALKTPEAQALFGGTVGVAYDPCYHLSCDDLSNVSRPALERHAAAITGVTAELVGVLADPVPGPVPAPGAPPVLVPAFTG